MNPRGFTLLEVLVALAILSIAVVASIQGFAQGLRLLKLSGDHQEATLLADQKMREVVVPVEGREEGTETRFQWIRTVARLPTPEVIPGAGQPAAARWHLYQVDVQVRWDERREVHLSTMRTAPENAVPPGETSPAVGTPTTPVSPSSPRTDASTPTTPRTSTPTSPRTSTPTTPRTPGRSTTR